jgi:hypothetical protein
MQPSTPDNDQSNVEEGYDGVDVENGTDGEEDRKLSPDELAILEVITQQATSESNDLTAAIAATATTTSTNKKKKNSKKKKKAGTVETVASPMLPPELQLQHLQLADNGDAEKTHAFWNTQVGDTKKTNININQNGILSYLILR